MTTVTTPVPAPAPVAAPVQHVQTAAPVVQTAPAHVAPAVHHSVLVVPDWVLSSVHFLERNWVAIVGIVLIALISAAVTEVAKHKWSAKYEQDKAKAIVRWVLLAVSTGFTALGTVIYFMQTNGMTLSKIPFIGQNEVEVLGAAWALYNFRLNKTFANIRAKLASWSDAKVTTSTTPADSLTPPATPPTPPVSEFKIN